MVLMGKRIKELRNKARLTQTELAKCLGVTKFTIAAYENDSRQPSYDTLIKIAKIFHVTTDYLLLNDSNAVLKVDNLTEEQIQVLGTIIDSFHSSNFLNEVAENKSPELIDLSIKFKEKVEEEDAEIYMKALELVKILKDK